MALSGDRIGVRRVAPAGTLGGGVVIDPVPARHWPGKATREAVSEETARPDPPSPPRSPPLDDLALRALELIRADGASPRAPAAVADALSCELSDARGALEALVAAGRATRVKPGIYYEAETLAELRSRLLAAAADRGGEVTLAETRDLLGTSRKYAQALLEHLDAGHLTIRHGDRHVMRRAGREVSEPAAPTA
jgi:selenocysteine-specific elongation factor